MASRTWKFTLKDHEHTVTVDRYWTGRRIISIDGKTVLDRTPIDNLRHEYDFSCAGHKVKVVVGRSYLTLSIAFELFLDGELITPHVPSGNDVLLRPAGHTPSTR